MMNRPSFWFIGSMVMDGALLVTGDMRFWWPILFCITIQLGQLFELYVRMKKKRG